MCAEPGDRVAQAFADLDADDFATRRQAGERLAQMATDPNLRPIVEAEVQRAMVSVDTPFEVRKQLLSLGLELPSPTPDVPEDVSDEEIVRLVDQLEAETYGVRLGAKRRIEWLLSNPRMTGPIFLRLKDRLRTDHLSLDGREWLQSTIDTARASWLLSEPTGWRMPEVPDEQVSAWLDALADQKVSGAKDPVRLARSELKDLLAQESQVERLKETFNARLAQDDLNAESRAALQKLLDLTRPAMVAEYWEARDRKGSQHLLVDVPSMSLGAVRPSHFDRIDDRVAHCVSGSNLTEGDYPVGVAVPHPNRPGAIFHLVNLPTPRRRMAYEYLLETKQSQRLAAISRRTFDRWLARKQHLTEPELGSLVTLDRAEMSRFAARMLKTLPDQDLVPTDYQWSWGRASHHGVLSAVLARWGTEDAIEPLLEAIDSDRIREPNADSPYDLPWIAILAISHREGGAKSLERLATLLDQRDPLLRISPQPAELGATAAAILLSQGEVDPESFGLIATRERLLAEFGLLGYRYKTDESAEKVRQWWTDRQKDSAW